MIEKTGEYCKKHPDVELVSGPFYKKVCEKCRPHLFDKCYICGQKRIECLC